MRRDIFPPGRMTRGVVRSKEASPKSALDYKEVYEELANQNEILIKMTETKKGMKNLEANFDRKMMNVLLKQL